ncbi:MAG TPA: protein-disulfide reductase DsbD [Burkholderiaceae bacterium]|jgi:thiol:disulfide interchange protein DsbD
MLTVYRSAAARILLFAALAFSLFAAVHVRAAEDEFLDPGKAFQFSATMRDAQTAAVSYKIADGYHMYRERFKFEAKDAILGDPVFPPGKVEFDETFQKNVETYRNAVTILVPVKAAKGSFTLSVTGQGCADKGLCYPPMQSDIVLVTQVPAIAGGQALVSSASPAASDGESGRIEAALQGGKLMVILPLFLLIGLGLSFTPCVLPLVPILSSIIVGEGAQVGRRRGFALSVAYSLGMALVYTSMGVAAGLVGEGLAARLQNPWVLGSFAVLMLVLSLAMFDVYQLQMPSFIQTRLTSASGKQAGGKLAGVFVMGALSALIVGPCVAAPLASALVYLSQTHDVVVGGSALFAMACGMSVPLLLVGLSAGSLLPRAGMWMVEVKHFFGVLMIALALWMVSPVLAGKWQMLGWAAIGVVYGSYLIWHPRLLWLGKMVGLLFALFGCVQLVGLASGGADPWAPLARLGGSSTASARQEFVRVKSVAELDAALARTGGKPVLLDFYADWCVSCKEMEKLTFPDRQVQAKFNGMTLLQADVTANSDDDKALLKRFRLFGPPGIILFDKAGREIEGGRVIGFQDAARFNQSLNRL